MPAELLTGGNKVLLLGSPKKRKYSSKFHNKSEGEIRADGESESSVLVKYMKNSDCKLSVIFLFRLTTSCFMLRSDQV